MQSDLLHGMEIKQMTHLENTNKGYFNHLIEAGKVAFILIVHGLLPNVWETKASDIICTQTR